ncbi:D-2-hydroxyacid dehydrogenase [Virgibacillus oceani]|uniref:Glycerate dehydrogenase n=1 Tax=Virgibacillus oceani TaxID=1479511 RepID=A0A917HQ98_9BACI|nr:D-2-hydroxyacid dehydrogenase [Virgibacillus oceani]GGG87265.1 glycerate dehydrogenase [Virgibacillus oceani]
MSILFTAKLSSKHQTSLTQRFPELSFIFCNTMDEAKRHLSTCEIVVSYGSDFTEDIINQASNLKWIMVLSAGLDQMPFEAIKRRDIVVTNSRGIHKVPMSEYAIFMLLQVYRNGKQLIEKETSSHWDEAVRIQEITGKTMLVVGAGAIGQEVARLAKAFRMKTIGVSRSGRSIEHFDENYTTNQLEDMLPEADFVVSVLPSTRETVAFYAFKHFELMPDHAVFLNMGRGNAVKGEDLLKAVRQGEIAHAILDVFEEEPLPKESPLWQEENITVTPHLSGKSRHYVTRALEIFENNLHTYMNGKMDLINKIDVTRGY